MAVRTCCPCCRQWFGPARAALPHTAAVAVGIAAAAGTPPAAAGPVDRRPAVVLGLVVGTRLAAVAVPACKSLAVAPRAALGSLRDIRVVLNQLDVYEQSRRRNRPSSGAVGLFAMVQVVTEENRF